MHVFAFLLSVVGIALSLVYSDVYAAVVARGVDFAALKDYFTTLDPKSMCVVASSALAVLGALFALGKKRFGSLLLAAAAGVCLYCEFKLGLVYPYVRAAAGLFGAAAVFGWFRSKDDEDEEEDQEWEDVVEPVEPAEPEKVAAEASAVAAPAEAEGEGAVAAAPVTEEVADEAPAAAATKAPSKVNFWGLIAALAAAGYSLYMSGLWDTVAAHGTDLSWLKGFASFDTKTKIVLGVSALSVLGGVIAFFKGTLGTTLLFIAAVVCGVTEVKLGSLYPWSWGAFVICLAAAAIAWPGQRFDEARSARRYTGAYVYAFLFGLAAAAFALYASRIGCAWAAKGCSLNLASEFAALDCRGQAIVVIAAVAAVGAVLSLFGVRLATWLLLAAMIGSIVSEVSWTPFYAYSWVTILLLALAAMLSGAFVSAAEEKIVPSKKLTLHGAFLTAVFAAVAGGALMWYYNQSMLAERLSNARANDPAYQQLDSELKARDASIAAMNGKVQEQLGFVAERDSKIASLTEQGTAKDAEIAALTKGNADRDAKIAALNEQLEAVKAQLAEAQAATNKKYVYMRGSTNVRTVPNSDKGSKVIGRLTDAVAEVLDTQRPAGSSANWYQVKYGNGTGWVFGKNAVLLNLKK